MNSRLPSLRVLLGAAVLALGVSDAGAVSVGAMIDGTVITPCLLAAGDITWTAETDPVWAWTCGTTQHICVQGVVQATYDLDSSHLTLQCLTVGNGIFIDNFD